MVDTIKQVIKLLESFADSNCSSEIRRLNSEIPEDFNDAIQSHQFRREFTMSITYYDRETISTLCELGVNINEHDNTGFAPSGTYPLTACIHAADFDRAKLLLDLGADPNLCSGLNSVSYLDDGPESQIAMAQLLIDYGADVNLELPKMPGVNPLVRALEKGHEELAAFLVSKGAVIPEVSLVEKPELDLATFQTRLEKACRECWASVATKFPKEHFCLFGLETDSDFVILNPLFDSEGAIDRDRANRRNGDSYVARVSLDSDSEFYGEGREFFDALSDELNSMFGVSESRLQRRNRIKSITKIFEAALKNLDQDGVFGLGPSREKIILLISIIDADEAEWKAMLKLAKRLNPKGVFLEFKNSLS